MVTTQRGEGKGSSEERRADRITKMAVQWLLKNASDPMKRGSKDLCHMGLLSREQKGRGEKEACDGYEAMEREGRRGASQRVTSSRIGWSWKHQTIWLI